MAPCEKGSPTVPVITTSLDISNKNKISYFFKKINGIQQSAKKKKKASVVLPLKISEKVRFSDIFKGNKSISICSSSLLLRINLETIPKGFKLHFLNLQ